MGGGDNRKLVCALAGSRTRWRGKQAELSGLGKVSFTWRSDSDTDAGDYGMQSGRPGSSWPGLEEEVGAPAIVW